MPRGKGERAGDVWGVGVWVGVDGGTVGEQQDRTTVPEGLWEQGLCHVPHTGPRGPRSHQDTYSAGLGIKGGLLSNTLCGPQGQEEWGQSWMAKWLISGAASGSFSGLSTLLCVPFILLRCSLFLLLCLCPFFFLCVSLLPCFSQDHCFHISVCVSVSL